MALTVCLNRKVLLRLTNFYSVVFEFYVDLQINYEYFLVEVHDPCQTSRNNYKTKQMQVWMIGMIMLSDPYVFFFLSA